MCALHDRGIPVSTDQVSIEVVVDCRQALAQIYLLWLNCLIVELKAEGHGS